MHEGGKLNKKRCVTHQKLDSNKMIRYVISYVTGLSPLKYLSKTLFKIKAGNKLAN